MVNYENGKIYAIKSKQTDKIYIGSTNLSLAKRWSLHKSNYKKFLNNKCRITTSFEILEYGDAYIELLENYPCENREQLLKKERKYIEKNKCVNISIPYQTEDEKKHYKDNWYIDNKDRIKEKRKIYYKNNREKEKLRNKKYRSTKYDCPCGSKISLGHRAKHYRTKKHVEYLESL